VVVLGDRGSRSRCLLVWVSGTATLWAPALFVQQRAGGLWPHPAAWGALPLDRALQDLSVGVLLVCAAWAWMALSMTVVEAWRGVEPRRPRLVPDGVRRAVLAACGVALATSVTGPAVAAGGAAHAHHQPHEHGHHRGVRVLTGLPLPDRAVAPGPVARRPLETVLVRPGDCLWSLARHDLPRGATPAEIDARWQAIYAANRDAIGPDPDLVRPGQRLRLPRKDSE
jgi:hypothetical protein